MANDSNIHEIEGRKRKTEKLVAEFQQATGGSAHNVSLLDDLGWQIAERAAEVKPASAKTRQAVVEALQAAEDYRAVMFNTVMGQAR